MKVKRGILVIGLLALPASGNAAPTSAELSAAAVAEARGAMMYEYDQAAWHTTDRFNEDIVKRGSTREQIEAQGAQGYIVEPGDAGALTTTFFGVRDNRRFAIARYARSASGQISGGFVEPDSDSKLSPLADRMVDARSKAISEMATPNHGLCSPTQANSLVLPPDTEGVVSVYILTSTEVAGIYPAGGHYRFDYDADGKKISERRFMNTCFPLDTREKDGKAPEMVFLTHLLDPQPTEIHAFVSRNIPVPMAIGTIANKRIWGVSRGHIEYIEDIEEKN